MRGVMKCDIFLAIDNRDIKGLIAELDKLLSVNYFKYPNGNKEFFSDVLYTPLGYFLKFNITGSRTTKKDLDMFNVLIDKGFSIQKVTYCEESQATLSAIQMISIDNSSDPNFKFIFSKLSEMEELEANPISNRSIVERYKDWRNPARKSDSKFWEIRHEWVINANYDDPKERLKILDFVFNDCVGMVRESAVKKVTDQGELWRIFEQHPDCHIKELVLASIENEEKLKEIAISTYDLKLGRQIVSKLKKNDVICCIAEDAKCYFIRQAAYQKLGKTKNVNALNDIIKHDESFKKRRMAYIHLGKEESAPALLDIILNDKDFNSRKNVLPKLKDKTILNKYIEHFNPDPQNYKKYIPLLKIFYYSDYINEHNKAKIKTWFDKFTIIVQ